MFSAVDNKNEACGAVNFRCMQELIPTSPMSQKLNLDAHAGKPVNGTVHQSFAVSQA